MEIIILTMSIKHSKYCIAGVDVRSGSLFRLVSSDIESSGAIQYSSTILENGCQCKPLDLVYVPISRPLPLEYQPENLLINENSRWSLLRQSSLDEVLTLHPLDNSAFILGSNLYYLSEPQVKRIKQSLTIVKVSNLRINQTHKADGNVKTKCSFICNYRSYNNMSVTDPLYFKLQDGFIVERAIIVVSIPNQSYNDKWFKFVSRIFPLPQP